eukprot:7140092-Prymnesium_polylepis.2
MQLGQDVHEEHEEEGDEQRYVRQLLALGIEEHVHRAIHHQRVAQQNRREHRQQMKPQACGRPLEGDQLASDEDGEAHHGKPRHLVPLRARSPPARNPQPTTHPVQQRSRRATLSERVAPPRVEQGSRALRRCHQHHSKNPIPKFHNKYSPIGHSRRCGEGVTVNTLPRNGRYGTTPGTRGLHVGNLAARAVPAWLRREHRDRRAGGRSAEGRAAGRRDRAALPAGLPEAGGRRGDERTHA